MTPNQDAHVRQAELFLRSHPTWSDAFIASQCKLTDAEVAEVRTRVLGAAA